MLSYMIALGICGASFQASRRAVKSLSTIDYAGRIKPRPALFFHIPTAVPPRTRTRLLDPSPCHTARTGTGTTIEKQEQNQDTLPTARQALETIT
jgi:hypothetical protein